ncbi:MAG: PAS domain S-box protein [Chlorobi bacterium]|nr:PAS domain S-box protein [Chlorobiota bacterium]
MTKILAIDDQRDNLLSIKALMQMHLPDCEIITALSAKEGIQLARESQPDTILLDIIMPGMDGYEACRVLKADNRTSNIPVIMLTAIKTDSTSRVKALETGADAFVAKPIDTVELTAQVKVMLRIKKAEDKLRGEKELLEKEISSRTDELIKSEQNYKGLIDLLPQIIYEHNLEGRLTFTNNYCSKLLGYSPEELSDFMVERAFIPEDREILKMNIRKLLNGEPPTEHQFMLQKKDGSRIPVLIYSSVIYRNKKADGIRGVIVDISRQKTIEKNLKESEERFKSLYNNSTVGLYRTTPEGEIVMANPALVEMLGFNSFEELKNRNLNTEGFDKTHSRREFIENIEKTGKVSGLKSSWLNKKGVEVYIEESAVAIRDSENKTICYDGTVENISRQTLTEKELKESVLNFKLIFENSPIGIYLAKVDGEIINANKSLLSILDSPSLEATKSINVLKFPPLVENGYARKFDQCSKDGVIIEFDMEYESKWGKKTNLHSFLIPLKNEEGEVSKVYTLIEDITARKRTENKLRESETRFAMFMDNIPAGIFIKDADGKFLFSNKYNKDVHGLDNWEGKTAYDFFPRELADKFADDSKKVLDGEDIIVIDYVTDKNNNIIIYKNHEFSIKKTDGTKLIGGISLDITKEKLSEIELKKSEERFDLAMKASNDGLFDWDLITNEVYYSERWKNILGYADDELPNEFATWDSLCHQGEKNKSLQELEKAIAGNITYYNTEFRMRHKLGHWVNILSRAQIIYDEQGKAIRVVGTHSDLTEQKKAEHDLKDALAKAEESDRLKSAFLANMSHEIRTPMNGILGFSQLLKSPKLSGEQLANYVEIIEKSGHRMLNIINNLIDISKIEAGQVEINMDKCDIDKQMEFIYSFFKAEANKKGIELIMSTCQHGKNPIVKTDREKLYAILTNLVKNAIKYCHEGSIEFGYHLPVSKHNAPKKENDGSDIQFFVKDTGIGIPADRQEAIFDRFVQADIEDSNVYEGAGLGLAITKAYVEMLGGQIGLESEEGTGSRFYFTLPYTIPENADVGSLDETAEPKEKHEITREIKVLIVEDEEFSDLYITLLLRNLNTEILHASNGKTAVEIMKQNPDIDLLLMDIKMPVMNGYEATERIREFNDDVIIIAQTAYALEGDKEKALASGCTDYISKPIDEKEFMEMIEGHLS